jgi:HEAT repeat protein
MIAAMERRPREDMPDEIWIGPVGPIPIFHQDDPRFVDERAAWSIANKKSQAMHSADELIDGLTDPDWRVRFGVVDRLIARARDDDRTLPALLRTAEMDPAWQVRSAVAVRLHEFERSRLDATLKRRLDDPARMFGNRPSTHFNS